MKKLIILLTVLINLSIFGNNQIDSISNKNFFESGKNYGKTVGVLGGSLSVLAESNAAKNMWRDYLKMDVVDYGVGGAGFSSLQGFSMQQQADKVEKKDIYILWASTNDCTNNREVGEWTDYTQYDNYDTNKLTTQCGGINYCIKTLLEKNPECEIYFFTSLRYFGQDYGYNPFAKDTNAAGYTLMQYIDAQKKCCEYYSIPVLDQFSIQGVNLFNYQIYYKEDKLHMNNKGYEKIGMKQVEFLTNGR